MHQLKSIRRVALGAALAGASTIADPTCVYRADTHAVSVVDKSGPLQLRLLADGLDIGVQNVFGTLVRCHSADGLITADVLNTDSISVTGAPEGASDGSSEIEISFATRGIPTNLDIQGTDVTASGLTDTLRFGRIPGGLNGVSYGPDDDVDYRVLAGAKQFTASGNAGNEIISATGNPDRSTLAPTTVPSRSRAATATM